MEKLDESVWVKIKGEGSDGGSLLKATEPEGRPAMPS